MSVVIDWKACDTGIYLKKGMDQIFVASIETKVIFSVLAFAVARDFSHTTLMQKCTQYF